jgi:F0F1-type ATP synthase membrane subunit b/b'
VNDKSIETLQEIKTKDELTDRVLSEAQRSAMDLQELNAWMQTELEKARKGHQTALAQASTAERKVLVLEVSEHMPACLVPGGC